MKDEKPVIQLPLEEVAIEAPECAKLFGKRKARSFLEDIACKPSFPKRVNRRPAAWIYKEVLEWREAHRDELAA